MTQEEKARRYDEAIKRAQAKMEEAKVFDYDDEQTAHTIRLTTTDIFPELKESEDERIRKEMISWLKGFIGEEEGCGYTEDEIRERIAWLEKQGKKKFEQKFFINDKVVHKATGKIWTIHHYLKDINSYYVEDNDGLLHHYTESELKLVEQKPADKVEPRFKVGDRVIGVVSGMPYFITKICDDHYNTESGCIIMFNAQDNFELVEQKTAWSEEDEENFNWFEKFFRAESVVAEGKDIPQDRYLWFKNLKDRVQPKPKQEWSEEDKKMLGMCIDAASGYYSPEDKQSMKDWLYSLKDRYTWKPSEEQMEVFNEVLNFAASNKSSHWNDYIFGTLNNLKRQLKKLEFVKPLSQWKPSEQDILLLERIANGKSNPQDFQASLGVLIWQLKKLREE